MKSIKFVIVGLLAFSMNYGQNISDSPEFKGENFSLEGALSMFKESNSLEDFEKRLNEESNNVNNLDLNNDGEIDYVIVDDSIENDNHVIILSTYLNESEKQEIATLEIEKSDEEFALVQLRGDRNLYAENTVVEPSDTKLEVEESKGGPSVYYSKFQRIVVNVWSWPCVRFVYAPTYTVWVSPHRWRVYPNWWRPLRPARFTVFYNRCRPHRFFFRRVHMMRNAGGVRFNNRRGRGRATIIHNNRNGNTTIITRGGRGGGRRGGRR